LSRHKKHGHCKICGSYGQLSFEHIPPKAAFNNERFYYQTELNKLIEREFKEPEEYFEFPSKGKYSRKMQGGMGAYTLCQKCNNLTGKWYAANYVDYAHQVMSILLKSNGKTSLFYPTFFFPLRVIKQVVTMFFSIKHYGFNKNHPDVVKFILNKESRELPKNIRVFTYFNLVGQPRRIADMVLGNISSHRITKIDELTFPPFGYVMTIDSESPDDRLTDITYYSDYRYNDFIDFYQRFNTLPTYLPYIPADYRTKDEIIDGIRKSKKTDANN
jgi:hypothetical protein